MSSGSKKMATRNIATIVWIEGWYVDEDNLSGNTITFGLNICNILFFIAGSMMLFKCKKIEYNRFKEEFMN